MPVGAAGLELPAGGALPSCGIGAGRRGVAEPLAGGAAGGCGCVSPGWAAPAWARVLPAGSTSVETSTNCSAECSAASVRRQDRACVPSRSFGAEVGVAGERRRAFLGIERGFAALPRAGRRACAARKPGCRRSAPASRGSRPRWSGVTIRIGVGDSLAQIFLDQRHHLFGIPAVQRKVRTIPRSDGF